MTYELLMENRDEKQRRELEAKLRGSPRSVVARPRQDAALQERMGQMTVMSWMSMDQS